MLATLGEVLSFLRARKKWWLMPIIVMIVLIGTLLVTTQGTAISTFIYALF